jgi:ribonuclease HI
LGSDRSAVAYSDGASRGNPGPAAYGVRIVADDGAELHASGARIGRATNNVAEYRGAIAALEAARDLGIRRLELRMDSELVVKQLRGEYRVKDANLARLKAQLDRLIRGFESFRVAHVRRGENSETDRLANEALDGE